MINDFYVCATEKKKLEIISVFTYGCEANQENQINNFNKHFKVFNENYCQMKMKILVCWNKVGLSAT